MKSYLTLLTVKNLSCRQNVDIDLHNTMRRSLQEKKTTLKNTNKRYASFDDEKYSFPFFSYVSLEASILSDIKFSVKKNRSLGNP